MFLQYHISSATLMFENILQNICRKKPTKLTLWEDFIDHEGVKLFNQLHDYPIILARKIGKSSSGKSANKFIFSFIEK